jgi:hypothetical protein
MAGRSLVVDDGTFDAMKRAARPFTFGAPSRPLREHPRPTVDMILAASEEMLPVWNADPEREAARIAQKCRVRFAPGPHT